MKPRKRTAKRTAAGEWAKGRCLCGAVEVEIGVPAFWAFHDHSAASRQAHGAAYATYVGCWKSSFRIAKGENAIVRYEERPGRIRSFCGRCGSPVAYTREHAPQMINAPRALFDGRTGREPLYHIAIGELPDWTYLGERLVPLKGFPGVFWTRANPKRRDVFAPVPREGDN